MSVAKAPVCGVCLLYTSTSTLDSLSTVYSRSLVFNAQLHALTDIRAAEDRIEIECRVHRPFLEKSKMIPVSSFSSSFFFFSIPYRTKSSLGTSTLQTVQFCLYCLHTVEDVNETEHRAVLYCSCCTRVCTQFGRSPRSLPKEMLKFLPTKNSHHANGVRVLVPHHCSVCIPVLNSFSMLPGCRRSYE